MNCANKCNLMDKNFFTWYQFKSRSFEVKCVFIYNNTPSQVAKPNHEYFELKRFTGWKIMELILSNPDLNSIENQWLFVSMELYEGGK